MSAIEEAANISPLTKPPADGMHDVPMEDYLSWDALNNSLIRPLMTKSPMHCKWKREHPEQSKSYTDQGTAMHMAILEPERFADLYRVVQGPWNRNPMKQDKEAVEAAGGVPIHPEDYDACLMARANVLAEWEHVFRDPEALIEQSIVWTETAANGTEVRCKIRPDLLSPTTRLDVDIKTHGGDISANRFRWTASDMGYDTKFAWYLRGLEKLGMPYDAGLILAIEQDQPCGVIPYAIDPSRLEVARGQCADAINLYAECLVSGLWPGYGRGVRTLFEER